MSELPSGRAMQLRLQFRDQWGTGKARQDKVKTFIVDHVEGVEVEEVGFGSNTTELLYTKNPNPGDPDLKVTYKGHLVTFVEATGGRKPSPFEVLVRTDKIKHAKKNPFDPVWFCHVCGDDMENVYCHDLKTALRHEFEAKEIKKDEMVIMEAVPIPRAECVPLAGLAEWIGWKIDFIKKVYGA